MPAGGTPAERFDLAFRKVVTVSKEAILKEEAKEKQARENCKEATLTHGPACHVDGVICQVSSLR